MNTFKGFVLGVGTVIIVSSCGGGGGGVPSTLAGLDRIIEYAQNGGILPTRQDYQAAGITSVLSDAQLAELNQVVKGLEGADVDTPEEIQTIANTTGVIPVREPNHTITHKGFTYGIITSPFTQKEWLDRNLGAEEVCDTERKVHLMCIGGFYQWGRGSDGHESVAIMPPHKRVLENDFTHWASGTIDVGHGKFIVQKDAPIPGIDEPKEGISSFFDWVDMALDVDGAVRSKRWSKTDGSSICPVGFRVPAIEELEAELITPYKYETLKPEYGFLKLHGTSLHRGIYPGHVENGFYDSYLWSSTVSPPEEKYKGLYEYKASGISKDRLSEKIVWENRRVGMPVRCIKD